MPCLAITCRREKTRVHNLLFRKPIYHNLLEGATGYSSTINEAFAASGVQYSSTAGYADIYRREKTLVPDICRSEKTRVHNLLFRKPIYKNLLEGATGYSSTINEAFAASGVQYSSTAGYADIYRREKTLVPDICRREKTLVHNLPFRKPIFFEAQI